MSRFLLTKASVVPGRPIAVSLTSLTPRIRPLQKQQLQGARPTLKRPGSIPDDQQDASNLPGLTETAARDELIDLLLTAKDSKELTQRVAENMLSFDQRFWLRLATRTDTASLPEEKDRLAGLAKTVMQLVDAMVKKTTEQLDDSSTILQMILAAAADETTGEWKVPLQQDEIDRMKAAMDVHSDALDEALLSNCFAWMRKASDDNLDGMVVILQKVLQLYSSRQLCESPAGGTASPVDSILKDLIAADESKWSSMIREKAQSGEISEIALMESIQRKMEGVVLGLASGSYAQRVQAEYLKELESRAKSVFADLASGK